MSLDDLECDVQPDGQPPPTFGERYLAVHPTGWGPGDTRIDYGLDEVYRVTVTITMRAPKAPRDRLAGEVFLKALTGMEKLARDVVKYLHQNHDVVNVANADIAGTDKLMQPLFWDGTDVPPRQEGGEWVWSDSPDPKRPIAALVLPVHFREARRMQSYGNME
jgi:hypothetical protein